MAPKVEMTASKAPSLNGRRSASATDRSSIGGRTCADRSRAAANRSLEISTAVTLAPVRATFRADQPVPVATSRTRSPERAFNRCAACASASRDGKADIVVVSAAAPPHGGRGMMMGINDVVTLVHGRGLLHAGPEAWQLDIVRRRTLPLPAIQKARPRNRFIPNNRGALLLNLLPLIPPLHFYFAFKIRGRKLINRSENWATIRRQSLLAISLPSRKIKIRYLSNLGFSHKSERIAIQKFV